MNAQNLLHDLAARGIVLSANGDQLEVDAPDDALTDELLATLRAHKAELLALLRSGSTECSPIGTFAQPRIVRTKQSLSECPWLTCGGPLNSYRGLLYKCVKCGDWFKSEPMDFSVFVGDLNDAPVSDASDWVM